MISLNSNYTICSSLCPESAIDIMWKIKQDLLFYTSTKTGHSYVKHGMFEILKHSKQYSSCHGLICDHQMDNWKNIPTYSYFDSIFGLQSCY